MLSRLESRLTYKPTQDDYGGLKRSPPLIEAFIKDAHDNKIHVAYRTANSSKVVIFAHGRDGNMTKFGRHYAVLDALEYSYMTFDYPGFGRSSGVPTENGLYDSAKAVLAFAKKIFGVDDNAIILFGLSLGAAITLDLAQTSPPLRLILESPFTSSRDMGRYMLGAKLPLYLLVPNRYRNLDKIRNIERPILLLHGTADTRVPAHHSKILFESGGGPRTLITVRQAGHLDLVDKLSTQYPKFISNFIEDGEVSAASENDTITIVNART